MPSVAISQRSPPTTITTQFPPVPGPPSPSPYGAGVPGISAVNLRAEQAEAPGVAEELGGGFQHPLPAGEVVLGVAVEVPAQPGHAAPVTRLQADVHPCAWRGTAGTLALAAHSGVASMARSSAPEARHGMAGMAQCSAPADHHGMMVGTGCSPWHGQLGTVLSTSSPPWHWRPTTAQRSAPVTHYGMTGLPQHSAPVAHHGTAGALPAPRRRSHLHPRARRAPGGRGGGGRSRHVPAPAQCHRRLWGAAPRPRSRSRPSLLAPARPSASATPPQHVPLPASLRVPSPRSMCTTVLPITTTTDLVQVMPPVPHGTFSAVTAKSPAASRTSRYSQSPRKVKARPSKVT